MTEDLPDDQVSRVLAENATLRQNLEKYKSLEEDLAAQRVFEKAQKLLKNWITVGGIATIIGGAVGYKIVTDYSQGLVKDQFKAIATDHVEKVLVEEGKRLVASMVEQERSELSAYVAQQKTQLSISNSPLGLTASSGNAVSNAVAIPSSVDYTDQMQPVRDMGVLGAPVGFAIAAAVEYQIRKSLGESVTISPLYIYYYARKKEGTTQTDSGAQIKDGISIVSTRGAIPESAWPYVITQFATEPSASAQNARHYKVTKSQSLNNLEAIKAALATDGPVVVGISVYDGFQGAEVAKTGRVSMPKANEKLLGGHAVCVVGYDDKRRLLKFRNSWGANWGDKGYGYLPYEYIEQLSGDNWSVKL
jgi:C1A family cysteine protease